VNCDSLQYVTVSRRLLLALQGLLRPQQRRVLRRLGDPIIFLLPAKEFHVVLVGQGEDEALVVVLRPAGPAHDLVRRAGVDQFLLARRPLHQRGQHHRPRRQVDPRRQCLGTDRHGQRLLHEQVLDDAAVLRQQAGVMHADAAPQHLHQLRPDALRPVELVHLGHDPRPLFAAEEVQPLEHLRDAPALVAIEAEDQCGGRAHRVVALGHLHELLAEEHVRHPAVGERNLALLALHKLQFAAVAPLQPAEEFQRVADGGRQQQEADVRGQHGQGQLPDDAALGVGEAVELVHDDTADVGEVEHLAAGGAALVQQAVKEDFGHDDEDAGVGVDAAVAGDEADVVRGEAPADGTGLHLLELLLGERDEGRGVVGDGVGVQRLEEGGLGEECLAGAGRGADEGALLGAEPGQEGFFLDRVRGVGQLVEVQRDQFVAAGDGHDWFQSGSFRGRSQSGADRPEPVAAER